MWLSCCCCCCFRSHWSAYSNLVPESGIEPVLPALGTQSLNHWTTQEVPLSIHSYSSVSQQQKVLVYSDESRIEVKITESASCRRCSTVLVRTKYIHVHELPNTPCAISMIPHANEMLLNLHLKLEMQNINGIIHTSDLNSVFT